MPSSYLGRLSDEELLASAIEAIKQGAQGEANGGDPVSYGRAMDFMAESKRRLVAAGHLRSCNSGIYNLAFEQAAAEQFGNEPQPQTLACNCGAADRA